MRLYRFSARAIGNLAAIPCNHGCMTDGAQPIFPLVGPAARRYAELLSVDIDLTHVIAACDQLGAYFAQTRSNDTEQSAVAADAPSEDDDADSCVAETLWAGALVMYARCFATGKRSGLTEEDVVSSDSEALAFHENFIAQRNKHVAHSVNAFEQIEVGMIVDLNEPVDLRAEHFVSFVGRRVVRFEDANNLWLLATKLRELVDTRLDELKASAVEEAQREGTEGLISRDRINLYVASDDDAPRKRESRI